MQRTPCSSAPSAPRGPVGAARRIDIDGLFPRRGPERKRQLALALIIARLLDPAAKLATARMLNATTACHSLGLGAVTARELYATLDWLGRERLFIENTLARRHLRDGALLLYDVSSTYLEGRCCELAQYGYSRDHRGDRPQLVIGLLCADDGCPVAVEVFEVNTGDPTTPHAQIARIKQRFRLQRVIMVGDRGLITSARIAQTLRPAGLDWITALRAPAIHELAGADGPLQLSLFDDRDMAEITGPDYPGERLVVCKNPLLAEERARKRGELLDATEAALKRIQGRVQREKNPLRGEAAIGQAVGAVLGKRKVAKHFQISISADSSSFHRNEAAVAAEAALDGIYVLRTNLTAEQADAATTVRAYKSLARVAQAFRGLKGADLELRPVFHWTAPRVRAHVLLCMLAYYLEWHMRRALAPMLFDEHDPAGWEAQRNSPVAKATPSDATRHKATRQYIDGGNGGPLPVHSFRTLLSDLATLTRNTVRLGRNRLSAILTVSARSASQRPRRACSQKKVSESRRYRRHMKGGRRKICLPLALGDHAMQGYDESNARPPASCWFEDERLMNYIEFIPPDIYELADKIHRLVKLTLHQTRRMRPSLKK